MFCKNCGRQIPDNAAFCPACGTKRSGGDTYNDERSGRDIKDLPNYAKENDLNRSGKAIDSDRNKFSLSGDSGKKFSLSDSGRKKFSLSDSGQKKFSLSGKDDGGIVRISATREPAPPPEEPTGFVNPLKDSCKTVFHDSGTEDGTAPAMSSAPEKNAASPEPPPVQAEAAVVETGKDSGEEPTGFVNPLKGSGQDIRLGNDGDRNEANSGRFSGDPSEIDSHMGFAIFTLICCCQPTSILAIVFAILVSQEIKKGNYEQAQKYSSLVNIFCWISIGLSIFCGGISSLSNIAELISEMNNKAIP